MENLPITLILSVLLSLLVLLFAYYLSRKEQRLQKEEGRIGKISSRIKEDANLKADEVVRKAIDRAERIILDAEIVKTDFLKKVEENLERVGEQGVRELKMDSEGFDNKYKELFEGMRAEYLKHANSTLASVEKIADEELEDFRKALKSETVESKDLINKKVSEEFEKTNLEIQEYKKSQIDNIDKEISTLVLKISKEVLGKTLTSSEHEKIIIDSLEDAKKNGLFAKLQMGGITREKL